MTVSEKWRKYIAAAAAVLILALCPVRPAFADSVVNPQTIIRAEDGTEDYNAEAAVRKTIPADTDSLEGWPAAPEISAEAAILMDADTGEILYAKNAHEKLYPASTTKILTGLLAYENLDLDQVLTYSYDAVFSVPSDGSSIGIDVGEQLTVEQALFGLLVASSNESANALAEAVSGSVSDFADLMNQKAQELGCTDSHFANANGLFQEDHYTSCYDLASIGRAFFSYDTLCTMANTKRYHIPVTDHQPDDIWLNNQNKLINETIPCEGLVGSKTGYTDEARETLVSCAERNGLKLICVVMREEPPTHFTDTAALFDYGFSNFSRKSAAESDTVFSVESPDFMNGGTDIFGGSAGTISVGSDASVLVPNSVSVSDLETEIVYNTDTQETTEDSEEVIGTISFYYNGYPVGSADLVYTQPTPVVIPSYAENSGIPYLSWFYQRIGNTYYINLPHVLIPIAALVILLLIIMGIVRFLSGFSFSGSDPIGKGRHSRSNKNLRSSRKKKRDIPFKKYDL